MLRQIKDALFFPIASYFAFWAKIQLKKWNPRVIVITGSSGKTTLFALAQSQIDNAHFSHHANSAFGIPFDILDIHRKTFKTTEWFSIFLQAPRRAFRKPYSENIYVVECDADRPNEGKFLSHLLNPEVVLWLSSSRTHSMNFDKLVPQTFKNVEDAIAHEYGYFIQQASKLSIINGDSDLIKDQLNRLNCNIIQIHMSDLKKYEVQKDATIFETKDHGVIKLKALLPKEVFYSIEMVSALCSYLNVAFDSKFSNLKLPPARSSIFRGVKNITIIDSTYNANLSSMSAIISMFNQFPARHKWGVFGDMLEQGKEEQEEHEKLANLILKLDLDHIVLLGPRVKQYTYPLLVKNNPREIPIASFTNPSDVLNYLKKEIHGGETIL